MFEGDLCPLHAWPGSEDFVLQMSQLATSLASPGQSFPMLLYPNHQWRFLRAWEQGRESAILPGVKKNSSQREALEQEKYLRRRHMWLEEGWD